MSLIEEVKTILCLDFDSINFVEAAMHWIVSKKHDVHVEFTQGFGWSVSCCYEDDEWKDWTHDEQLDNALAKAVKLIANYEKI